MVRWLVVGSGGCGRGLDVGVARATRPADGRDLRRDGGAAPRTGAGPRCGAGCPATVEGQLTGPAVAAHQQPMLASLAARMRGAVIQADERPVVQAVTLCALGGGDAPPGSPPDPSSGG